MYKTNFPVIINLHDVPQLFTVTISVKLCRYVSSAVSHNIHIAHGSGDWNEKYYRVVAWCEQHGDLSIILTEQERKDRFEHRAKNQTSVFQLARETAYMARI